MTTILEKAFKKAAELPEKEQEAFAKFLLEELEFLAAIEQGISAADRGDVRPIEEVRKLIPQWISESSSPSPR